MAASQRNTVFLTHYFYELMLLARVTVVVADFVRLVSFICQPQTDSSQTTAWHLPNYFISNRQLFNLQLVRYFNFAAQWLITWDYLNAWLYWGCLSRPDTSCRSVTAHAGLKYCLVEHQSTRHSSKTRFVGCLKAPSDGQGKNKQVPLPTLKGSCNSLLKCRRIHHVEVWLVQALGIF